MRNVIRKLQARNRVHAIAIALERGEIALDHSANELTRKRTSASSRSSTTCARRSRSSRASPTSSPAAAATLSEEQRDEYVARIAAAAGEMKSILDDERSQRLSAS